MTRDDVDFRSFALRVVLSESLEEKLRPAPRGLPDGAPRPPLRLERPGRPRSLTIVSSTEAKVPPISGMTDPHQRARILHALANHELQATELFAWALLAFPEAPAEFRAGLVRLVGEEQRHCRLYLGRLEEFGVRLGTFPVSGYFWNKVSELTTPRRFVCALCLTFENANLDHSAEYAEAARKAGDSKTAALFERIGKDEVRHVRFGWTWLARWKEEGESMWDAYRSSVTWPLRPALARGERFHPEGRVAAGMDPEFIRLLAETVRDTAPGRSRGGPAR